MKNNTIFSDFRAALKTDILSGFLVSLIALPLSLGIANACGFPPIMGLITAITGGLFVSFFMGSESTIKGPAAGLIVIMAGCVAAFKELTHDETMAWQLTAAVVALAGVLQFILGYLKVARLIEIFPLSAVHGMLAAIGIIIMVKQLPIALGDSPALNKGKDIIDMILNIPTDITHENTQIAIIGMVSLAIMFVWNYVPIKWLKKIPAAFVVLVTGVIMGRILHLDDHILAGLNPLVHIEGISLHLNANFGIFSSAYLPIVLEYTALIVIIGSLESLLSAKAADLLDPQKRSSNMHRDLQSVGIGNSVAGLLGGLPMISEIVRSSANLGYGGRTRWSNFFHGLFLLIFAVLLYPVINLIPMASLAAMMMYAGFRLASPKEFVKTYKIGWEQFIIFIATIIFTLATDLLVGIFAGILVKIIIQLISGVPISHYFRSRIVLDTNAPGMVIIHLNSSGLFTNYLKVEKYIQQYATTHTVILDVSNARYIDHSFMDKIHELRHAIHAAGGHMRVEGTELLKQKSEHPMAARKALKQLTDTYE